MNKPPSAARSWSRRLKNLLQRHPFLIRLPLKVYRRLRPQYTLGAVGLLMNRAGQILLVEHITHPYHPWGLPGGWVDRGETPDQTVAREMREEVGLEVVVGDLIMMTVLPDYGHIDFVYRCYSTGEQVGALSPELLDYAWFDLDALPSLEPFQAEAIRRHRETSTARGEKA